VERWWFNNAGALGATNGSTTVYGPANTLQLGVPGGSGVTVAGEILTISGTGVGGALGACAAQRPAVAPMCGLVTILIGDSTARIGTETAGT